MLVPRVRRLKIWTSFKWSTRINNNFQLAGVSLKTKYHELCATIQESCNPARVLPPAEHPHTRLAYLEKKSTRVLEDKEDMTYRKSGERMAWQSPAAWAASWQHKFPPSGSRISHVPINIKKTRRRLLHVKHVISRWLKSKCKLWYRIQEV